MHKMPQAMLGKPSRYVGALNESALLKTFKTAPSKPVIVFSPWFISSPAVMPDEYL